MAKHAEATHVSVSVRRDDRRVLVQVADDGIGGAEPGAGSGLHGLADRVEALHGQLRVERAPGWRYAPGGAHPGALSYA